MGNLGKCEKCGHDLIGVESDVERNVFCPNCGVITLTKKIDVEKLKHQYGMLRSMIDDFKNVSITFSVNGRDDYSFTESAIVFPDIQNWIYRKFKETEYLYNTYCREDTK